MKRRAHYVLSSHWDREWYQPFQDYRYRLIEMFDQVLDGLASGELVGPFQTDGQAIILEDYLEVRPERREQVEQFAREGKLVIGPWYVLPDEFLVSGESLVRNIRRGKEAAKGYGGEVGNAGFVCDLFGHISQMPQIMKKGFGMKGGMLWRGNNEIDVRLVNWEGADGTKLPCYRFGWDGYCGYSNMVRQAFKVEEPFDAEQARKDIRAYIEEEVKRTHCKDGQVCDDEGYGAPLLIFDGGDHQEWDQDFYQVLKDEWMGRAVEVEGRDGVEQVEVIHSSLDTYLDEMVKCVGENGESVARKVMGEQREPGLHPIKDDTQWHIPGTLSSRVWIKQWNAQCQTLLTQWAEPLGVFGEAALGHAYPKGFLDVAWKWLIKNHPHDSICGCSVDRVHEDMKFRFSQTEQIGERLTNETMRAVSSYVEGDIEVGEVRVTVFNSLAKELNESVELVLEVPSDAEFYQCHDIILKEPIFHLYDVEGNEVPVQKLGMTLNRNRKRIRGTKFVDAIKVHEVKVSMPVKIAGHGYATYTLRKGTRQNHQRLAMGLGAAKHNWQAGMMTSDRSMSNGLLDVCVNDNGSLRVKDLRNGESYDRLLVFEDGADRGDGWYHGPSVADQIFSSTGCNSMVAVVADGPHVSTLRVRTVMLLPKDYVKGDFERRNDEFAEQIVDSYVTIRPGKARLEVETVVHNAVKDHRMRVLLPSGAKSAETYLADSPFDVIERSIALREDNHLYREPELETKSMSTWTGVADGKRGLVVVSEGLMESAVQDNEDRVLALTLFRGTEQTVLTNGEPGGQLLEPLRFNYWIELVNKEIDREAMCVLGQQLAAGGVNGVGCVRAAQVQVNDVAFYRSRPMYQAESLPACSGWLEVDGAVLSAAEKVGDALEIRVFNPNDKKSVVRVKINKQWIAVKSAKLVDFEGREVEGNVKIEGDEVVAMVGAKGIVTLQLR